MTIVAEIMDTTKICRNFPANPPQEIFRDAFLDTIDELFTRQAMVIVEGSDGSGKTTLLSQFARRHYGTTISVFITPATRSSYDPEDITRDLLRQAWWILEQRELEESELERLEIKTAWGYKKDRLQKKARVARQKIYFVIDGLGEIPDNRSNYRELILDLLPMGIGDEFRFLISGNSEKYPKQILELVPNKTFQISGFTLDDAYQNLSDLDFTKEEIADLYKSFRLPGQLASIRRLRVSSLSKDEFLREMPTKAASLLELEWKRIDLSNSLLVKVLSLLAFASLEFTLSDIAKMVDVDIENIKALLDPISFISLGDCHDIKFASDNHRKFAEERLWAQKTSAEREIIEHLKKADDPRYVTYLPSIYDKSENYGELLSFLTPENLSLILKTNQSLIPLRDTARLGVHAAHRLQRDGDLVGLGLQAAIVDELFSADIWESEINALIALRNIPAALALIERAITKEDRLLLLSVLASANAKHKLNIQGLEEKIKGAYQQINHQKLGDKAIDIAANLINIDSLRELAFDLVEKNTDSQDDENALDWALAKLSIKALSGNDEEKRTLDVFERIQNKIKDPKAQNFLTKGTLYYLKFSGAQIISTAQKMERASEQLYLLRSWVTKNREALDVADVVEFGLQVAIASTDYAPNARDFRELATPLPYIENIERRKHLISIIDGQKGNIERWGPTEEYIRIMLTLGIAEKEIDTEACINRFIEAYLYSSDINDLSTKSACLARIISALVEADPEKNFEKKDSLHSIASKELASCVDELLGKTADQYMVTKGIIRALAKTNSQDAFEIAIKLNGEDRRDRAIYNLVVDILDMPDKNLPFDFVKSGMIKIVDVDIRDELLIQVLSRINAISDELPEKNIVLYLVGLIKDIRDAADRCNACCIGLLLLNRMANNGKETMKQGLTELLSSTWDAIDVGWLKIDVGFKVVEALSEIPDLSEEYYKRVETYRDNIFLDSDASALTYLASARLCVRAFSGLFAQDFDTENDLMQVVSIIENIPSMTERVGLYTDLALRFHIAKKIENFNDIVGNKLKPCLEKIPASDGLARRLAIVASLPALYLYHPVSAMALIQSMSSVSARDDAYRSICSYILTKKYNDPYYDPISSKGKKLTHDEIMDVINILKEIDNDSSAYSLLLEITESIDSHRHSITKNQKSEIARQLEEIARKKFPNQRYIKHNGYLIISLAQIYKIRETKPSDWNKLIDAAENINLADQVLVLSDIAKCLPSNQSEKRKQLLNDAETLIKDIPSVYDQVSRYEALSQSVVHTNERPLSQKYLKLGMEILANQSEPDMLSVQRRYIDIAYKIDPDFAASLASMADDDPAREKVKTNIQKRYAQLKLKAKMSEYGNKAIEKKDMVAQDYPSVAWMLLGSLNAGRSAPMRFDSIRDYAQVAAELPIAKSYPIYAWLIQNNNYMYQDTPQCGNYLRPLFDATIRCCKLIISIAQKSTSQIKLAKAYTKDNATANTVVVDMDYEAARTILVKWLKTNVHDELYIADGYFGLEELWVLQVVKGINPSCKVYILTSKKHNKNMSSPEDEYQNYWKFNLSDQEAPPTEIVIVSEESTLKSPIHDRWWVAGKAGIRIGTSANSLGGSRISEISSFSLDQVEEITETIKRFVVYKEREYKGEKLRYSSFTL